MQHRSSSALHRWTTTGMFAIDQLRCTRKCLLGRHCSVSEQLIYAAKHLTASVLRSWPKTGMVAIDQLYCSCKCLGVIAQFQDRSFMFVPCAIKRAVSLHNYTHVCYRSVTLARFGRHCSVSGQLMHVPNIVNQACNIVHQAHCIAAQHAGLQSISYAAAHASTWASLLSFRTVHACT